MTARSEEDFWRAEDFFDRAEDSRNNTKEASDDPLFRDFSFPSPLSEKAFCGLAGDIVRAIEPHTEACSPAILACLLTYFGNAVGRGPHFVAGDVEHATGLYVAIIGETGGGRKGTATAGPRKIMRAADPEWAKRVVSGLGSGEGIIHACRDERRERRKATKDKKDDADEDGMVVELVDPGVADKRLMVDESEFAKVLIVSGRKDSLLADVLKNGWEDGTLQTANKHSPERATGVLLSVVTQITPEELQARLESVEMANGFMNRFAMIASRRSKSLPRGGNIPTEALLSLTARVKTALDKAKGLGHTVVDMTDEAWALWDERYDSLVKRPPGIAGTLTQRATPMVRRLAMVYALLDSQACVQLEHLEAALELWRYVEESTAWVYGDLLGDDVMDVILGRLEMVGSIGLSRTDVNNLFWRNVSGQRIGGALKRLEDWELAFRVKRPTGGRPEERWYRTGVTPMAENDSEPMGEPF